MKIAALISAAFIALAPVAEAAPLTVFGMAQVRSNFSGEQARDSQRQQRLLPVSQVIAIAQRRHPGTQVLDVNFNDGEQPRYTVILKTRDGRRVDVIIDALNGRILSERGA